MHPPFSYAGACLSCGTDHTFTGIDCSASARSVMEDLARSGSFSQLPGHDLQSTDFLFGQARGKMFGVMQCLDSEGKILALKAFSGQFNGLWLVEGWVPPLFDVEEWNRINTPAEREIKRLGEEMQSCPTGSLRRQELQQARKILSQKLMKELHAVYRLTNFRGKTLSLKDIFSEKTGIPTGTGDCCAPKLFNFAATRNLIPIGIAEFYWGRENKSATKLHGRFYPPCTEKCRPILGFMLCGLEVAHARHKT
ncbi:MAG: hypothetical protein P4L42_07585 [Desulfocapsaceae bacterium]|nr:hypothetical protein [Desulfocapsaceae bacterium]